MQQYHVPMFIETGTFTGSTAYWASQHFQQVFTIEFAKAIHQQAVAKYGQIKNIAFLYGDTRDQLARVVDQLSTPGIFWLDAHWSAGATYGEQDECPVLDEIEVIQRSKQQHFILIDDARMFLAPPPRPHKALQWPDIATVIQRLNTHAEQYIVVLEDVIISAPSATQSDLREFFHEYTTAQSHKAQITTKASRLLTRAKQLAKAMLMVLDKNR